MLYALAAWHLALFLLRDGVKYLPEAPALKYLTGHPGPLLLDLHTYRSRQAKGPHLHSSAIGQLHWQIGQVVAN